MVDDTEQAEVALAEEETQSDLLIDILSGEERKPTEKEQLLQEMIKVLAGEYHFPLEAMERDIAIPVEVDGKRRTKVADLVIFNPDLPHMHHYAQRIVVVQPPATKPTDRGKGIELLKDLLDAAGSCEYGLWTNGRELSYIRKIAGPVQSDFVELSDFPANGESLADLDRPSTRSARVAVGGDLRETILRCHDYLYGNQSMTATRAFSELVKLIFSKIYDEQQLRKGGGYQRQFWVGVREWDTEEGQREIELRIKRLFSQVKDDPSLQGIFRKGDEIELEPRHLAWIARELSRYNFLDAEVDVKGTAYEAMVATTMKRERGQFFTPRNVVEAMVEILAPQPGERVLALSQVGQGSRTGTDDMMRAA